MSYADPLHTVRQAAELLQVQPRGVLVLIANGELRAIDVACHSKPGGKPRWRIRPDDLESFLSHRTRRPDSPKRRRRKQATVTQYF